jgi:DNA-binding LytR/AlgR family response regulator
MVCGRSLLHAVRLDGLTTQLPANFLRIHRSVIANLDHGQRLERDGDRWRLHLSEGPPCARPATKLTDTVRLLTPGPLRR